MSILPGFFPSHIIADAAAANITPVTRVLTAQHFSQDDVTGSPAFAFENNVPIGTPAVDRIIAIAVSGFVTPVSEEVGLTQVRINGIQATRAVNGSINIGNVLYSEIWWAHVPEETTALVEYDANGQPVSYVSAVYAVYGCDLLDPIGSNDSNTDEANRTVIEDIFVDAKSVVIACGFCGLNSVSSSSSWTNITEDTDQSVDPSNEGFFYNVSSASRSYDTDPGDVQEYEVTSASANQFEFGIIAMANFIPVIP